MMQDYTLYEQPLCLVLVEGNAFLREDQTFVHECLYGGYDNSSDG